MNCQHRFHDFLVTEPTSVQNPRTTVRHAMNSQMNEKSMHVEEGEDLEVLKFVVKKVDL